MMDDKICPHCGESKYYTSDGRLLNHDVLDCVAKLRKQIAALRARLDAAEKVIRPFASAYNTWKGAEWIGTIEPDNAAFEAAAAWLAQEETTAP